MKKKVLFIPVILFSLLVGLKPVLGCELKDIKISENEGHTQCLLVTGGQVVFEEHALSGPSRVYVDLMDSNLKKGLKKDLQKELKVAGIIKSVRVAQFKSRIVRVVFEFENSPNVSISRSSGKNSPGLALDFSRGFFKSAEKGNGALNTGQAASELASNIDQIRADVLKNNILNANVLSGQKKEDGPGGSTQTGPGSAGLVPATEKKNILAKKLAPAVAPAFGNSVRMELARKSLLPFHKWRVVIDPGHGGKDPGTMGKNGFCEKMATLSIARRLAAILKQDPSYDVYITRDQDKFISLDERTLAANRFGADIFVSIHVNSSPHKSTRGITTYFLNWTDDGEANRVAARENQISLKRQKEARTELGYILASLELEGKRDGSLRLANYIEDSVMASVHTEHPEEPALGVKEALFYVLVGDAMPAVLVETSFMSNKRDEKLLQDDEYIDRVAKGIAAGIGNYFRSAPVHRTIAQNINYRKIAER